MPETPTGGPPLAGDTTLDVDPLAEAGAGRPRIEHQRIVSVVRRRLFGHGRPPRIGRYTVERRLGSGGMGEVYLAHDESLDRKIAIKRVHTTSARERDQERLRREARALARLSHPNVVQIYEVDEHEGRTFLAMEYVDGQTLGEWLEAEPRSWRAVLETFLAAGRGLAAAHDAGLVHRDFKPGNVLLGRDGGVHVADFGLALAQEDRRAELEDEDDSPASSKPNARLSAAGAILGTIAYMPYEQLCGSEVDARSDQFSFCVALYEALWGTSPFSMQSTARRLADLMADRPAAPRRRKGRPPSALWRVVRRGLRRMPAERWPDMPALLRVLEGVLRRRRRVVLASTAVVGLALAIGLGALAAREDPAPPCATIERELDGTWDEARRSELQARAAALEAKHARDSQQRVVDGLDRWAAAWLETRAQSCLERAERRIDPALADRKSACLTRQRRRVGDLVDLLLRSISNGDTLAAAVDAVAKLPPGSSCNDELALMEIDPPPMNISERVEELRREIDRAHELRLLGFVDEALTIAEKVERAAKSLDYGPLNAEALGELAKAELATGALNRALPRLQDAIDEAELARHERLAADLWIELATRTLVELNDPAAGMWQIRRAEVANARLGAPPHVEARLVFGRAQLAEQSGHSDQAEQRYREALSLAESDPAGAPNVSEYMASLARLLSKQDTSRNDTMRLREAALAQAEAYYGADHPRTLSHVFHLASYLQNRSPERASKLFVRFTDGWSHSRKPPKQQLARARLVLARRTLREGRLDLAREHAEQLATIQAERLPDVHVGHGQAAHLLAVINSVEGDHAGALRQARIALSLWQPHDGSNGEVVLELKNIVISALLAQGRLEDAEVELETMLPDVRGRPEEVPTRLHRCELSLRRMDLDAAHVELRNLGALDTALIEPHRYTYALLRALTDLRRGALRPDALDQLRDARTSTLFTTQQLEEWFDQLGLSREERARLAFN